ncbi:MAG: NAD(P)/FAD-dependent oxidoreductase [Caulobacteraceae bacterium]
MTETVQAPAAEPEATGDMPQSYYDSIKARFADARDLRLKYRPQGTAQYTSDFSGDLAKYAIDPHAEPAPDRAPIDDKVEVLFIGGGFSALLTAARLRERGVESIRIVERGADVGGQPGTGTAIQARPATCRATDYLPLLDEMNYVPSRLYAKGPEIYAHCQAIAKRYDLYDLAVFRTTVLKTTWDNEGKHWLIETDRGDRMRAKFVICANGTLSKPKLSKIAGMESFAGHSFHTSRWDYAYTGQDLENLSDKVVGIIGTGASAVQAIPRLGKAAKALYVFQRTPSGIDIRGDRPTDPEWQARLKPGWQQARRMKHIRGRELDEAKKAELAALSREEKIRRQENANIDHMMRIHAPHR